MQELAAQLEQNGWVVLITASDVDFERLAYGFGSPRPSRARGPAFERLSVLTQSDARAHSQSARYGEGAFPFHTDAAHWPVPARFLALRSATPSSRPTLIVDAATTLASVGLRSLLENGLFAVVNGRHSFLAAAWDQRRSLLRYDPTCMRAVTRAAARAAALLDKGIRVAPSTSVNWSAGTTVIIDNWRCLHARGVASEPDVGVRQLTPALLEARD